MSDWKEVKEAFVSGHEGTSPWELLLVVSTVSAGWFFYSVAPHKSTWTEIVAWILPMILCQSKHVYPFGTGILLSELLFAVTLHCLQGSVVPNPEATSMASKILAVTIFRSGLICLTAIAILAVDFHLFPRRFCKTEVQGYSLMDLGAAAFVVAAGIVSPRARHESHRKGIRLSWKRILPLVFMGMLRLLTHKGLDYPEHASEYGVHWNFFFTMAFLSTFMLVLPGPSLTFPVLLMTTYQTSLMWLQNWIETGTRVCSAEWCWGLFVANREGILGCVGYTSLFLMSEYLARHYFWHDENLSVPTVLLGILWRLLVFIGVPVSRRSTNAAFCVWTLFVCFSQLYLLRLVTSQTNMPKLLDVVNRNGLIAFIIANLLTGIVNLSINTLNVPDHFAIIVLAIYMAAVFAFTLFVDKMQNRLGTRRKQK